ncbi:MAG: GNAT family N-acetyltransferase [Calditrichaeota bacterium]|nr:GNAT family N-acetyltransferase [Calditrichota bacterium]RQW07710.1 MAG: GNAT family N-acetyltransferase [Calditrichota bacterium]
MKSLKIVTVDPSNFDKYGLFCVQNIKHPGYIAKRNWIQKRFGEGLRIKIILTPEDKPAGFLEYMPGENTWRVVNAPDYLVIHCIWVRSNQYPYHGMASSLIGECIRDAESEGKIGVAVVVSDGPWMAGKEVYLKNGFAVAAEAPPRFELLFRTNGTGPLPNFPEDWDDRLQKFHGLHLIYTNQCPYIGKAVTELPPVAKKYGIHLQMTELQDASEAHKRMPSPYGVVSLIYNGRLLADHPISATRFRNILRKELELKEVIRK